MVICISVKFKCKPWLSAWLKSRWDKRLVQAYMLEEFRISRCEHFLQIHVTVCICANLIMFVSDCSVGWESGVCHAFPDTVVYHRWLPVHSHLHTRGTKGDSHGSQQLEAVGTKHQSSSWYPSRRLSWIWMHRGRFRRQKKVWRGEGECVRKRQTE